MKRWEAKEIPKRAQRGQEHKERGSKKDKKRSKNGEKEEYKKKPKTDDKKWWKINRERNKIEDNKDKRLIRREKIEEEKKERW